MNISQFIEWFLTQFIRIGTNLLAQLNNITIYQDVTLLEFIITITIIGIFIGIILTVPQNMNKMTQRIERKNRSKNDRK